MGIDVASSLVAIVVEVLEEGVDVFMGYGG
jgi:hypothetical protein